MASVSGSESFHLLFIHTDTGGRNLETSVDNRGCAYCRACHVRCGWSSDRCVILAPRHETEAWALSDPQAIANALGYRGPIAALGLPADGAEAERLVDPKAILEQAARRVQNRRAGGRGVSQLLPAIAQAQTLTALRMSQSFRDFEASLRAPSAPPTCSGPWITAPTSRCIRHQAYRRPDRRRRHGGKHWPAEEPVRPRRCRDLTGGLRQPRRPCRNQAPVPALEQTLSADPPLRPVRAHPGPGKLCRRGLNAGGLATSGTPRSSARSA